jgi:hypothetical protein
MKHGKKSNNNFSLNGYESISVPRPESLKSKRGHGGLCLLYKQGIIVQETDSAGFIWVKLCKTFFFFLVLKMIYMFVLNIYTTK